MELYNEELKNRFLATYPEDTAKAYRDSLCQISEEEEFLEKDVFKFSIEELHQAFKGTSPKTEASANRIISPVLQYIKWANQEGYIESKIDYTSIFTKEKMKEYVWNYANENMYFSRDRIHEMCNQLFNSIDKGLVICALEGIDGLKHSEIMLLKDSDINFSTGETILNDIKGNTRTIIIEDKRSLDILKQASEQKKYTAKNGQGVIYGEAEKPLVQSPYIFRVTSLALDGDISNEPVKSVYISNKFTRFFKGIKNKNQIVDEPYISGYPFLNLTNIFKSGFFDYCLSLEKERGELGTEDYKEVCIRYGVNVNLWHTYKTQYLAYKENQK